MAEIIQQRGLIDKRFEPRLIPTYTSFASLLSILSLALMAWVSLYCRARLADPCTTYQLPGTSAQKFFWQKRPARRCMDGKNPKNFVDKVGCLFPGITYRKEKFHYEACRDSNTKFAKWTLEPFRVLAFVAVFGCLFELYLLLVGEGFHFKCSPFIKAIHQFWEMLYSFVMSTSFFCTICLTADPNFHEFLIGLLNSSFFLAYALVPALYFGRIKEMPVILSVVQYVQFLIVISRRSYVDDWAVTNTLAAHCLITMVAWLIPKSTPERSACFHLLLTLSVLCQYVAMVLAGHADPTFPRKIQEVLYPTQNTQLLWVISYISGMIGFLSTNFLSMYTYQAGRSMLSYIVWSSMYFFLLFRRLLVNNPYKLSDAYKDNNIRRLSIQPYSQQHWKYMPKTLAVPSVAGELFPETVEAFADLRKLLASGFEVMTTLGHHFPQAVASTPLRDKVRMEVNENGENYYPSKLFSLSPTFPARGKKVPSPPAPMEPAFKEGRLLAYLCQYGIGTSFLQMAKEIPAYPYFELLVEEGDSRTPIFSKNLATGGVVLDFRDLEFYETKPDYEPYGGIAFFKFDERGLKLEWVVTPKTQIKTLPDPMSGTFRRAESMILSSMYFKVVVGKHLVEIHMTFNLLEVALHNAFDYDLNKSHATASSFNGHPIRLILYIHLFNHILAAELTVCHLVQEGAVFSQIWALTYDSLLNYITIQYNTFKYASDENWEYREAVMAPLLNPLRVQARDQPSFTCALQWELIYKREVFDPYASSMVDAIYESDQAVQGDDALKEFFRSIHSIFAKIPQRYQKMETKDGLKRFISDTINHLCVRHEFYGTNGVAGAMDPRLNCTQTPRDGGPPAVDEWRSLAFVSLATAYVDFVHLLQDPQNGGANNGRKLEDIFDDATPIGGKHDRTRALIRNMKQAFINMQRNLRDLHTEWYRDIGESDPSEGCENYMYFRPMPADLSTGPGY